MERYLLLQNARIADTESSSFRYADILIKNKTENEHSEIIAIGENLDLPHGHNVMLRTLSVSGNIVCPSFTDMRCDICEPGRRDREDISTLGKCASYGGFGALLTLPVREIDSDAETVIKYILENEGRTGGVKILPTAPLTRESLKALDALKSCGAVALADDGSLDSESLFFAMKECAKRDILLVLHCEDPSLSRLGVASEGNIASMLSLPGVARSAEESALARNIIFACETGCRVHISHISTAMSAELIRLAKKRGARITCDTSVQYFALSENDLFFYSTSAKFSPPLRSRADADAIIEAIKDGTVDCISSDHLPKTEREKDSSFITALPGVATLQNAFTVALDRLVMSGHIDIFRLISLFTSSPASVVGQKFEIREGEQAYLNIISLDLDTYFQRKNIQSRCKSSPFLETTFRGCLTHTVIDGQVFENPDVSLWN